MTEIEKIEYAKSFIDKLADGINPLTDEPVADNDVVNNVRISRCFFYVSDILRKVIEKGGLATKKKAPKGDKLPFALTLEQTMAFQYSAKPIPLGIFADKLYAAAENENMQKITYKKIADWLVAIGMLRIQTQSDGKNVKRPTEDGEALGISVEKRLGAYGEFQTVVYDEKAQRFIVDNMDAIVAFANGDVE